MTSIPAEGTNALEQLLHDLVYVILEHEAYGHSICPCEFVTSPVKLSVTGPQ